jgi:hypothetical protein
VQLSELSPAMAQARTFSLEPIRTDGWFERIGEGIGSFQALCEIIGPRFFAFAMVTGARIVALTVDRRNPESTMVDFSVEGADGEDEGEPQRLNLSDFRRRLVAALLTEESYGPAPERPTEVEALQLHIGVRHLLLAPLYGYSLSELRVDERGSELTLQHDGINETHTLEGFRERLRGHVREELARATRARGSAIELGRVEQAEQAAAQGDQLRVLELLGAWPAPLAIFLRTPEGQLLPPETRSLIAKGLGLLGSACISMAEIDKGEEVLRLAVQYAGDTEIAPEIYMRLGESMMQSERPAEAIGPLRRAANLGAAGDRVWPLLARALLERQRHLAALAAAIEAREAGVSPDLMGPVLSALESALGPAFQAWRGLVEPPKPS